MGYEQIKDNKSNVISTKILSSSGKAERPKKPDPIHYFNFARNLVYITLGSIIILGVISVFYNNECITTNITSFIKDILYPFLTLLAGFLFGKGMPKK